MRQFLIFILGGVAIVTAVYFYAQTKKVDTLILKTSDFFSSNKGKVLSAQKDDLKNIIVLPVNLKIDKQPVYLYWPQTLTVETKPGAEVKVVVTYPSGSINNSGTKNGYADKDGKFVIKWTVNVKNNNEALGIATIKVNAKLGSAEGQASGQFEIVKYGS